MADGTAIEWTDATWNPVTGCSVVSPGCTNCYAMRLAGTRLKHEKKRVGLTQPSKAGPVWTGEVRFNEDELLTPLSWRRPRMIFVCAHGDLFHEAVPDEWIDRVFAVMALCPQHTFQVLTKRSARMRAYLTALRCDEGHRPYVRRPGWQAANPRDGDGVLLLQEGQKWPLSNVWMGVSAEDQTRADKRLPDLMRAPVAVRWVSAEPMLGPIDFRPFFVGHETPSYHWDHGQRRFGGMSRRYIGIDWLVVGGESGPAARPMHPDWARSIRDQCDVASVPFFFKQWGEYRPTNMLLQEAGGSGQPDVAWPDGAIAWGRSTERGGEGTALERVGKKAAGRTLDGVTHDAMPLVRA